MTDHLHSLTATFEEAQLTLDELCRLARVSRPWVVERVETGLLLSLQGEPAHWRFDAVALQRVRRMSSLERDFDAAPELAALVADLQAEIESLRNRLSRAGLQD